jgi:hypothetical protein
MDDPNSELYCNMVRARLSSGDGATSAAGGRFGLRRGIRNPAIGGRPGEVDAMGDRGHRNGVGARLVVFVCSLSLRVRGVARHCMRHGTFSVGSKTIHPQLIVECHVTP